MPSLIERVRILRSLLFGYPAVTLHRLDYDDYWDHRKTSAVHPRHRLITALIEPHAKVLDIGCGDGAFLSYLIEKKQVQALGLDISSHAVSRARARGVPAETVDITRPDFYPPQVYDYIVLSEVLEHLTDPEDLLVQLQGYSKKGLLVTLPNTGFWPYRLRLLLGRFPVQWALHPGEHLRFGQWPILYGGPML